MLHLIQPNLVNKQQNILNLCLLLTYIIVRRVYQVLGILQPTVLVWSSPFQPLSYVILFGPPNNKKIDYKRGRELAIMAVVTDL